MLWAKIEDNKVTGTCNNAPPANEAGERELGWEQREENDAAVQEYLHPPEPIASPDWERLTSSLRGSAVWAKAFGSAMQSIAANAAMTLMLSSLTATHSLQDLRFAFVTLRQIMLTTPGLADFSVTELSFLKTTLAECGFDAAIVDVT